MIGYRWEWPLLGWLRDVAKWVCDVSEDSERFAWLWGGAVLTTALLGLGAVLVTLAFSSVPEKNGDGTILVVWGRHGPATGFWAFLVASLPLAVVVLWTIGLLVLVAIAAAPGLIPRRRLHLMSETERERVEKELGVK